MKALVTLALVAAIGFLIFLIARMVVRRMTGEHETTAKLRGRQIAKWRVQEHPEGADIRVVIAKSAVVDGIEYSYAEHPVGTVKNDDDFVMELERLRFEANQRCIALNDKVSPDT